MRFLKASWLAWALCGAIVVATLFEIANSLLDRGGQDNLASLGERIVFALLSLEFAVVAALILARQPHNAIGWLLMLPAAMTIPSAFASATLQHVTTSRPAPTVDLLFASWFDGVSWAFLIFPILLLPLLFPTGRPPAPRWRWVIYLAIGMIGLFTVVGAFSHQFQSSGDGLDWSVDNPIGFIHVEALFDQYLMTPWTISLGILTVSCAAALVVRYRRSSSVEREQIKWLMYACAVFCVVYVIGLLLSGEDAGVVSVIWSGFFILSIMAIPAAIAVAILRHRLWDIDVIIRRTLLYAALTLLLALLFFGSVILLQRVFVTTTGQQSQLAVVLSTLAIAALVNPLRTRIQAGIDRRFYRKKYDAQLVLARFAVTARDETDMHVLAAELGRVVRETVQPELVSVWLFAAKAEHPAALANKINERRIP